MTKYSGHFEQALTLYCKQAKRPGYVFGLFSSIRHSKTLYPHIAKLQYNLNNCDSDAEAKKILISYFQSPQTKLNNHSFALYLLDLLCKTDRNETWEIYYPKEKRIKFYTGTLYRGTLQAPHDALANGIMRESSENIEDYADDTNGHIGISTSKDFAVAKSYQTTILTGGGSAVVHKGYIYKIDYPEKGAIDIIETLRERGKNIMAAIASHKNEVNIIGRIAPQDIVGYWDQQDKYHANPNYVANRQLEENHSFPERLESLFKMSL